MLHTDFSKLEKDVNAAISYLEGKTIAEDALKAISKLNNPIVARKLLGSRRIRKIADTIIDANGDKLSTIFVNQSLTDLSYNQTMKVIYDQYLGDNELGKIIKFRIRNDNKF